ncbi:MAG: RNA 2',3'-cyclic phosphodiesterase [Pseudomonadota bacterium]
MTGAPRPARVFFALWPDARVRTALHRAARALHAGCGGRAMRPANIHLTLVFVGDLPETRLPELCAVAGGTPGTAMEITIDRAVFWPRNRIAWVGPGATPPPLAALVTALEEGLAGAGFRFDRRPYLPHITLLRNARCHAAPSLAEPVAWKADEFVLARSTRNEEGAAYDLIGRWPLADSPAR